MIININHYTTWNIRKDKHLLISNENIHFILETIEFIRKDLIYKQFEILEIINLDNISDIVTSEKSTILIIKENIFSINLANFISLTNTMSTSSHLHILAILTKDTVLNLDSIFKVIKL